MRLEQDDGNHYHHSRGDVEKVAKGANAHTNSKDFQRSQIEINFEVLKKYLVKLGSPNASKGFESKTKNR